MTETVQLRYVEQGQGQPVLLLHGFPLDHTIWNTQVEALSARYHVIAPDLRGHGKSPLWGGAYPMEDMAADVAALLDALGIERAAWIGHSMGGYVVMAALRTVPERVAGAGLVATHPFADSPEKRAQRERTAQQVLSEGTDALVEAMLGVLFAPDTSREVPYVQRVAEIMRRTSPQGIAAALRGMATRPSSVKTLLRARVPTVLIAGTRDQIVTRNVRRRIADQLPPVFIRQIEDAGHMPMLERAEETSALMSDFLADTFGHAKE